MRAVGADDRVRTARGRGWGGPLAAARPVLEDALRSLPEGQRAALTATYFGGRTVREAARALGVPPGTVAARLNGALRAFRLALAERGVAP
ncbi:sigma factor-like helix-turn-helix DNA-binding protein [Streptomyces sp. URMC 123]|uniref:sigma factor-like helix-turn-helix DNA-binding protein n=1 Tax=Streptomyces sp. URMC 123 TaxID=3423403 RepID=UPI003F193CDF